LYQNGVLESKQAYEDRYHACYARRLDGKILTAKIRLGAARFYLTGSHPKCLDIGCSVGATVRAAMDFGWQASGIDISETAIKMCQKQGLDCQVVDGLKLPFADNSFDLVTHWHVIEHVDDIKTALAEWRRVLKPGGVMMFETPNSDYIKARLMGPRYKKFWTPEHLYIFNRANLSSILQSSGFEIIPTRLTGGIRALPIHLNGYATLYRGFREICRSARICKSFEITCRKVVGEQCVSGRRAA
jgi:ubiquinone/menaquinone biosynthesis C-methylase UbiE